MDSRDFPVRSDVDSVSATILFVTNLSKTLGIQAWLCYGALLGMVREGRLLPWNNDAELACWYSPGIEDLFVKMADILSKSGYRAFYYSGNGCLTIKSGRDTVVNLNIFWCDDRYALRPHETASKPKYAPLAAQVFYWIGLLLTSYRPPINSYRNALGSISEIVKLLVMPFIRRIPISCRKAMFVFFYRVSRFCGGSFQKTAIPLELFQTLAPISFYGGQVLAPENPENLLEFIYGPGWETPRDAWSFYDNTNKSESKMIFLQKIWDYKAHVIV